MVPKKRFSDALDRRKFANGHSTIVKTAMNKNPETRAIFHGFHAVVFCQRRSRARAGAKMRMGNLAGTRWVTGVKTGPSFGCAGKSGRMSISAIPNSIYTAAVECAAHLYCHARDIIAE